MQVAAVATPRERGWRWRIVNYAGEVIEESPDLFGTIAAAIEDGSAHLVALNVVDRSEATRPWRRSHRE
ncbi:MAG TPA: hypothetical protein VFQ62_14160 [Methylomirabilota bacterium]|nr:hypothetical protein [Methylomirabilota bacterium]